VRKSKTSAAIVKVSPPPERPWLLNQDEVAIVKNSIAKGASDQELQFCLTVARRYRLDPFKQQIWFVKRWDKEADNGNGGKGGFVWTPQVGINGLLFASARDHKQDFGSVSLPEYGPMVNVSGTMAPEWAKVTVWKRGESPHATEAQAWWSEYAPADLSKAPFWRKMPRRMIAKCATALAIRQAYPDLGGLYIPEECERMNETVTPGGRRIIEKNEAVPAAQVTEQQLQEYESVTMTPWKEGRVALSGNGLNIVKANLEPEAWADLGILLSTADKVVHMPEANVFKFQDRAERCNVIATLSEKVSGTAS
jgi:RecT family